jgi:hypothetical protein
MQLPSTGPLKLAIRWHRNRLKLRMISEIQISRFSITERENSAANSQHSEVQACCQVITKVHLCVLPLCDPLSHGIRRAASTTLLKTKKCSRAASRSQTLKSLEILFNGNIFDAISGIFHIHGYNSSLSSPTCARGFVASPQGSALGFREEIVRRRGPTACRRSRSPGQRSPNPWGSPDPRHQAIARNLRVFFVSR